jgi:hypothetical protein
LTLAGTRHRRKYFLCHHHSTTQIIHKA